MYKVYVFIDRVIVLTMKSINDNFIIIGYQLEIAKKSIYYRNLLQNILLYRIIISGFRNSYKYTIMKP